MEGVGEEGFRQNYKNLNILAEDDPSGGTEYRRYIVTIYKGQIQSYSYYTE